MAEIDKQNIYRILIVDEDAALREMLAALLRAPNRSVEVCDTARAAMDFLQQNPVDIAFVDALLAGAAAQDLADTIKKRCPHAQVIVCAGRLSRPWDGAGRVKKSERGARQPLNFGEALQLADSYTTE
jgi:DNA-binding NtrC family response regulator